MQKIGIAEDDPKIASLLQAALEESGYEVLTVSNGNDARNLFLPGEFNLFIFDIMMPGLNGLQLCKYIREQGDNTPILMLTAMGTVEDRVNGLDTGADDYLVKPFHLKELLARVAALLRRQGTVTAEATEQLCFEDLCLDTRSKSVTRAGQPITLSAKEFTLLELFLNNPNRLLSRQYIAEKVWDIHFETGTNVIDVYINFLRNKIEKGFERKLIHTKINMGYILK
ncbi:response regulator transcription factor [Pedobacter soli]|uniref:DNA-binding response regulator, OmpR family, contains REC and winged-helix (WHTH) domain n=1 Tax=Pedobacter soli TaxID=390242 RepID=A0A1G6JKT4_9SPHI|nr:response regulator transcription factor [Pedobacter soli]SDC19359.1 DNA-binding response regulator, OmpR family, contains REC and winged-helix (wHTH) domain [Pedobacter soli]